MRTYYVENVSGARVEIADLGCWVESATQVNLLAGGISHGDIMKSGQSGSLKTLFEAADLIRLDDNLNQIFATNNFGCDCIRDEQKICGTIADATYYVRNAGDDNTGLGTSGAPWETLTRAFRELPRVIDHEIKIDIDSETLVDAFPASVDFEFRSGGQILIEAPFDVVGGTGTYTVSSFTEGGPSGMYCGADIALSGSPGLTVNALAGKYVRAKTGTKTGYIYKIWSNTASSIRVIAWGWNLTASDTIEIVEPGGKFSDTSTEVRAIRCVDLESDPGVTGQNARIAFVGCEFTNSSSMLSFVDTAAISQGSDLGHVLLERSMLNGQSLPDMTAITSVPLRDSWQFQAGLLSLELRRSIAVLVSTPTAVLDDGSKLNYSAFEEINGTYGTGGLLTACMTESPGAIGAKCRSAMAVNGLWAISGSRLFAVSEGARMLQLSNIVAVSSGYAYILAMYYGSKARKDAASSATGSTADILWGSAGGTSSWPGSGASVTDSEESRVWSA